MERMAYSAAALGEMDLYLGLDRLRALDKQASFRFLSANLVNRSGNTHFEPYVLLNAGTLRIIVLGLTQPPSNIELFETRMSGSSVRDPFETAARMVPKLRPKCDILVILSNLGYRRDLELARHVKGIDVIIGGRTRRFMNKPVIQDNTLITSGYFQGRVVGRLVISYKGPVLGWISEGELDFMDRQISAAMERTSTVNDRKRLKNLLARREIAGQLTRYFGGMVNLDPTWADDPGIVKMISDYRKYLPGTAAVGNEK